MTLFSIIWDYERCAQCFEVHQSELDQTLEKYKEEIISLPERTKLMSSDLRRINEEIKRGKKFQYHQLRDYWDQEKISELDSLVELLGHDICTGKKRTPPSTGYYREDTPLHAVKEGILWQYKGKVHVNPGVGRKIRNGAIATSVIFGGLVGLQYAVAAQTAVQHPNSLGAAMVENPYVLFLSPAAIIGYIAAAISIGFVLDHPVNPFENVAEHLEGRSQYVLEKASEFRKK